MNNYREDLLEIVESLETELRSILPETSPELPKNANETLERIHLYINEIKEIASGIRLNGKKSRKSRKSRKSGK
jgi:hypothetical protein